jgi:hypothetical protein
MGTRKRKETEARQMRLPLYGEFFSEREVAALGEAAANGGLAQEIEMLRLKLREALGAGAELAQIVMGVRALTAAVKVQHTLGGAAARNLEEALGKVLEEIGNELDADRGAEI